MRGFWLFVAVTIGICGAFGAGLNMFTPHPNNAEAQHAAIFFGFASALSWGHSVVGALMGATGTAMDRPIWNSWFNFFAAAFAALAVGLTAPWV